MWAALCLGYGGWIAIRQRDPYGPLAGFSAMVMHLGWSAGFWRELLASREALRGAFRRRETRA
jgi:succinoglycan biosynthesis protein ExoA